MFTDECKISLSPYTHDWIRLEPSMQEKLRKGEKEAYDLNNRPIKKKAVIFFTFQKLSPNFTLVSPHFPNSEMRNYQNFFYFTLFHPLL